MLKVVLVVKVMEVAGVAEVSEVVVSALPRNRRRRLWPEEIVDLEVEEVEQMLDIATTSR